MESQDERRRKASAHYLCIVGTVICRLLLILIHVWLAAIGRADDCFCHLQFWLIVINILQDEVQFDLEVSRSLFVHSLRL